MLIINHGAQAKFVSILIFLFFLVAAIIVGGEITHPQNETIRNSNPEVVPLTNEIITPIDNPPSPPPVETIVNTVTIAPIPPIDNTPVYSFISSKNLAPFNVPFQLDLNYTQYYFSIMHDFAGLEYVPIQNVQVQLKSRNVVDDLRGYEIGGKRYAIHLLACFPSDFSCAFRINGIPTRKLREGDSFALNDGYILKINKITIDECDGRRFCDIVYDSYDTVDIEVIK